MNFEDLTNYIFESYINSVPQYFYLVDPFSPSGIVILIFEK